MDHGPGTHEYHNLPCDLHEYNLAGEEVAHQTLPPLPYPKASYGQALFGLVTPPAEAVTLVGAARYMRSEARSQGGTGKPTLLHDLETAKYFIPGTAQIKLTPSGLVPAYLILMLLSAAASAVSGFVLARRFASTRVSCIGWALTGFLFGWVGLLLMFAIQEWPALISCPSCRKFRVVTRPQCEHCGAAHAVPESDGTEIFEQQEAVQEPVVPDCAV